MVKLTESGLETLRDRLRSRGERPSVVLASNNVDVMEAISIVQEYGPFVEAMFLIMLSDKKVKNVERDVLRGALRVISNDRVRSTHLESMIDIAARRVGEESFDARLASVIERLQGNTARAEMVYVVGAAVAAADGSIVPEEQRVLDTIAEGLGIDEKKANELLAEFGVGA